MSLRKITAHHIFWWSIPFVFFLIAFSPSSTIDLQMHDTYFVVHSLHVAIVSALLFALFGAVYWVLRKRRLIHSLSIMHAVIFVFSFIGLFLMSIYNLYFLESTLEMFLVTQKIYSILLFVILGIHVVFIFNVILGLVRKT